MSKALRIGALVSTCVALTFGITTLVSARGRRPVTPPPAPVLCGCLCPDGSVVVVHAPDEDSCPLACANACSQES